jgi:CysZ protein
MSKFFVGFGKGIADYGPALTLIFKHKLAWFFLVPIFLNILLFIGGFAAIDSLTNYLEAETMDAVSLKDATFWGAQALSWLLAGTIWLILKIVFFFLFAYTGGYIVLILMSPILAYLSEKTEQILTGRTYPFNAEQLMRDMIRGILIALRNLLYELLVILSFFILGLIPVIGWLVSLVTPIILFVIAAYFYGFSFTDYVNERQKLSVKQSVRFMKSNRGMITGNGMPFALILLIPFFGLILSGFIAIVAVVASVISTKDIINDLPKNELNKA